MGISFNNIKAFIANHFIPDNKEIPLRRYDLDWLRILVFGLLIFYHIGMLYVANWGFHFKSQYQSQSLELVMLAVEPWRMAVLWIISGIAIKFLLVKVSIPSFILKRSVKLLLPLLFGILVIVPPQLYIEMSQNSGLEISYIQFLFEFYSSDSSIFSEYQAGIWPHIDVNHLWYLRSLWQYSIGIIFLLPILNSNLIKNTLTWVFNLHGLVTLFIAVVPLFLLQLYWESSTVRYPLGFTFLLYGYLIGWSPTLWQRLKVSFTQLVGMTLTTIVIFISFYQWVWLGLGENASAELILLGTIIYSMARLLGALTVLTLAYKYLNKSSHRLTYWSEGVYPFYILHQSIIIIIAYQLTQINLGQYGAFIEPLAVILLTIITCIFCYEIIRKSVILRPLFGLNQQTKYPKKIIQLGYIVASCIIMPITLKLLL